MTAQTRRHAIEVNSLKQKNSELDLRLVETRREADQFHKSNIEQDAEINTLSNKLSGVKMDLADNRPMINYGAQVPISEIN